MRILVATLLLALTSCSTARAQSGDKVELSVLAFNLALDKARKDSDACKGAVMKPLKDARDSIQTGATATTLTAARRVVEDLVDSGAGGCGEPVKRELQRALDRLGEAIAERGPAPAAASASKGVDLEAKKKCWNYVNAWTEVDPGCAFTRAGNPPFDKARFDKLKASIANAGDRFERTAAVERMASEQKIFLTCLQLSTLLPLFSEETDKVEAVKWFAKTLVDPQHAASLGGHVRNLQARGDMLQAVEENKERR